ncbi:hypothetical protein F7725_009054 [Dissostichus mawsoni]|uniref:Uncharacterized protein n=1 Tax=Dissostichus mawsoni TaxID=36200 RepID=A0A7J5Z617_DISMA|nr:hypothetical protein F7725_009054 [Dissostichus mawsoni]
MYLRSPSFGTLASSAVAPTLHLGFLHTEDKQAGQGCLSPITTAEGENLELFRSPEGSSSQDKKAASMTVLSHLVPLGPAVSLCLSAVPNTGGTGAAVTLSYSAAFPSAPATGVNDHVNCCHSSRAAECCSWRSMPRQGFSLNQASERGKQAGSRRVSTPTIWLKHFQPPPTPPKPASSCPPACSKALPLNSSSQ